METVVGVKTSPVRDQLRSGYDAVADQVGVTARTVKDEVAEAVRVARVEAGARVTDGVEQVRSAAVAGAGRLQETAREAAAGARSQVQSHPERWLLIAMGAGVLLGICSQMMAARRSADRSA